MRDPAGVIGKSALRPEGVAKVKGTARFADDLEFPDCLYGATVRSTVPHGRVKAIRFEEGVPWEDFIRVLPRDIPGRNGVALIDDSQPFLAETIQHIAEPLALIAHRNRELVEKALRHVTVEVDEQPAVFSIEQALAAGKVFKSYRIHRGDMLRGFREADFVLEEEYRTGAQEQLYIEPQGVAARAAPDEGITVWGSLQCPFYVQKALAPLFDLDPARIRVIQTETGGGFGGKEEYPNILAGHAALLSWKAGGRVVKMVYDRQEDLWATTKRHPSRTVVKAGLKRDGRLVALDIDFVLDGGAYLTLSSTVLSRGILHSFGPYRIPHADLRARVVKTNSNPFGAFRGFGAPQSIFALELHLTRAAHELGMDPAEIRRRNFLRKGDTMPTGQKVEEEVDFERLMDRALEKADYRRRRREYQELNRRGGSRRKGIALSVFFHGSGFTGSGEVRLASKAGARITEEGGIEILAANVEYGQGTITTFTQIAAEVARIPLEWIRVHQPDTALVPNSGPTVASRTTMIVGRLVERAVAEICRKLAEATGLAPDYGAEEFRRAARQYFREQGGLEASATYQPPPEVRWDEQHYRGEAYAAYSWSCDVADVELDLTTYAAEVRNFVSVVECGRVINPAIAAGQIEGGIAQSIGWALYEEVVLERGAMKNHQHTNYIIPTSADVPPIDVEFIEFPPANQGPFGAKGIGELPADGPAPAIAGAVAQALGGVFVNEIPLLPEKILEAIAPKPGDVA
jgi:CO/xanthine dehydrogenase Mo-binding subunit